MRTPSFRPLSSILIPCLCCAPAWAADTGETRDAQEVVVTATPLRESALETAQPAAVVGSRELVQLRTPSLGETLAAQPGISATWFGPQASRPVIRGQGGERVQMYEDGGEALDVSALSNDHATPIDPLLAQRVELVRGPATLLYGNGASAGLINVLTNRIPERLPEEPSTAALELRGDTALGERAGAARADGGLGAWAWHADLFGRRTHDVSIPGFALSPALREELRARGAPVDDTRGHLGNTDSESYGGAVGGSWVGSRGFGGVAVSRFDTNYGIPDVAGEQGIRIDLAQTRYDLAGEIADPLRGIAAVRVRAAFNDYAHSEVEDTGEIGTRFDQNGLDTRLTFDHDALGGWRGTFGAQHRDVDLTVTGEEALVPASRTRNTGLFVYEERPIGAVTIELGTRVEQQRIVVDLATGLPDYDRRSVTASAGGLWKLNREYSLALNLTSTERHPTATELYANGPHVAARRFEVGDPDLERERATTVDLGLRKGAGLWQGSLSVFHSDYSRYIFAAPTGEEEDGFPLTRYMQADARLSGFEAELRMPIGELAAGELSARLLADYVRGRLADGTNLPQIPPLRVGGELDYDRDRFAARLSVMHHDTQDRTAPNERSSGGYTMVDLDLSYRVPLARQRLLVFLEGRNLFDEEARRHTSPLKDIAPLPGRAVAGGVRLEL